jgi:hypothetical protein
MAEGDVWFGCVVCVVYIGWRCGAWMMCVLWTGGVFDTVEGEMVWVGGGRDLGYGVDL